MAGALVRNTAGSTRLKHAWLLMLCFQAAMPSGLHARQPPAADVHVHYKWSQNDVTSPQQALAVLERHNVALAVVIGTPAELALQLAEQRPEKIIAIWSPYRSGGDWQRWTRDPEVLVRARAALASGAYRGIGELHLIGGFVPAADTPVIAGLLALAAEYRVPILLHTELSRADYLIDLCQAHPRTQILWAHAGAILPPEQVDQALQSCPNLWAELSARDPWRFVGNPVTDAEGALLPSWRALIERWPDRFMIGTDPVWPVEQLDSWDQADSGWDEYARFLAFHHRWLSQLDSGLAGKIRLHNALRLFGRAQQ